MRLFNARIGGDTGTLVIARSGSHAAEIFVTHYSAQHGDAPEEFTITESNVRRLPLVDDLRALLAAGASGIVEYDEERGHTLIPM